MGAPTAKAALLMGITALVLPALCVMVLWIVSPDKDYGFLVYGATVTLAVPPALLTGALASWRALPSRSRWQAWAGLILALLATCIYVLGGVAFFFLLSSVLRHD